MEGVYPRFSRWLRAAIPWAAFAAAVAITAMTWSALERGRLERARALFERRSGVAVAELAARMFAYEQVLRAGAARVASAPSTSPREWRAFVEALDLPRHYPAMPDADYVAASEALRESDPARAAAIRAALETGEPAFTGRLPPDPGAVATQPAFEIYVPVRLPGASAASALVSGAPRIHDLAHGILDGDATRFVDTRIYAGSRLAPERLLLDTREAGAGPALFETEARLPLSGGAWTLQFLSRPEFEAEVVRDRSYGALVSGLVASVLAFLLARAVMAHLDHAQRLSMHDPLTGLFNRRYLEGTMDRELSRARRIGSPIGLVMLDIDHFKELNDTSGHDAGDFVLQRTAELLRRATRGSDIACRFGGEEFALILPGASLEVSRERAEAIRAEFEGTHFQFNGAALRTMTLSAGIAALDPLDPDWGYALHKADRALYTAKQAGRNRVLAVAAE